MAKNYYDILGVGRDATSEEIKRAFRQIARVTHPDANPGDPRSEARFRDAAEAYEVLSDPDRRRRYDRGDTIDLSDLFAGWGGLDDLLRSVFGDGAMFGSAGQNRPARGRDVLVRVDVDLKGAAFGTEAPVTFRTKATCSECAGSGAQGEDGHRTCPTCRGEGFLITNPCPVCSGLGAVDQDTTVNVEVPAGVSSGTRLRLSGRGESGGRNGPPGDLYVEVHVAPDPRFERHDADLIHTVSIGIAEASLGTRVEVPLVEEGETGLEIPPGTQPGAVFRMPGLGVTHLGRRSRGDLHVVVSVEVPTELTADEEELLRRWSDLRGERTDRPASTG